MINFFRWLAGYVEFVFEGGFNEGFINECFNKGIKIYAVMLEQGRLRARCSARTYKRLHRVALHNSGRLSITKRRGLIFPFLKLRNRPGLFAGALCFVLIVNYMGGFIWNVEILGNNAITDSEITDFLEENGFTVGSHWSRADKDKIENLMMASFDDCAWVHINRIGSTARVEINETVEKPEITDNSVITNVKASKDGIIVKAQVYDGWQVANKGDSVVKGDLLVTGIYESEKKKTNFFAHARGEFIAQVKEPVSITVSRQQSFKAYTEKKTFKSLHFFSLKIPLYIGSSKYMNSDETVKNNYIKINGITLPIGISEKTVKIYTMKTQTLSDKALTKLVNEQVDKYAENELSNTEIIKKDIHISLNSDEASAKGYMLCLEDIAQEVKISEKQ